MPPRRKISSNVGRQGTNLVSKSSVEEALPQMKVITPKPTRTRSRRGKIDTNPDHNSEVIDGKTALRASPDANPLEEARNLDRVDDGVTDLLKNRETKSTLSNLEVSVTPSNKKKRVPTKSSIAAKKGSDEIKAFIAEQTAKKVAVSKVKIENEDDGTSRADPDRDEDTLVEDILAVKHEAGRPPPVNSDYLPLPWKGRLGYACLNTYLRLSNPPVFSSRTCRIASILEHRHPLKDPSQPEHSTKNRPDKTQPADVARGKRFVEELGLANANDIPKMLRWNEKYGIRFLRLSSEMFPFASHEEYGYKLAPFASDALREAGRVAAKLGHRLTTHPGQFTQLGSPRAEVIKNAIRDLEYHDELLSLLKLPPQEDRDAVMILHLGGTFGDKTATLERFRTNYATLSKSVKNRLVLENDDVSWSVHDLLPLCEELNIPLVLDFHHHNIIFDATQLREGTKDIIELFPRIKVTWDRKGITQKMHYSEPTAQAVTGRQRRKHNSRPATLPPCPNDMDLMIEAKDKEQAVFELMRAFKLPGFDTFSNIIPYERTDDNKPVAKKVKTKKTKKQLAAEIEEFGEEVDDREEETKAKISEEEVGMGGLEGRVYWPPGMEEWLRPKKREVKNKGELILSKPPPENFIARLEARRKADAPFSAEIKEKLALANSAREIEAILEQIKAVDTTKRPRDAAEDDEEAQGPIIKRSWTAPGKNVTSSKKAAKDVPTPSVSDFEDEVSDGRIEEWPASDQVSGKLEKSMRTKSTKMTQRMRPRKLNYAESDFETGSDIES